MILYPILVKKRIQPLIRGRQEKCCAVALGILLITKEIQVQRISIKALIDYRSLVNIISKRIVREKELLVQEYPKSYQIIGISGKTLIPGKQITKRTKPIELILQKHTETISLDISDIASHNIVLGKPWLQQNNPMIDWVTE